MFSDPIEKLQGGCSLMGHPTLAPHLTVVPSSQGASLPDFTGEDRMG